MSMSFKHALLGIIFHLRYYKKNVVFFPPRSTLLDHDSIKEHSTRLADRSHIRLAAQSEDITHGQQLNGAALHHGSVVPDW